MARYIQLSKNYRDNRPVFTATLLRPGYSGLSLSALPVYLTKDLPDCQALKRLGNG